MTELTNNIAGVDRVWLEMHVFAGSNIYEACREVAILATKWKQPMCAELNGTWVHIMPGTDPQKAVDDFSKVFSARQTA